MEQWLAWLEKRDDKERYLRDLRRLSSKRYSIDLKGSDSVRIRAIEALAETDPTFAYRHFAQMNGGDAEKETAIFNDLLAKADGADLANLKKELTKARRSYYSETRSDKYLLLIQQQRSGE